MKPGGRSPLPTVSADWARGRALRPGGWRRRSDRDRQRFVDDDRPATAVPDLDRKVDGIAREADPAGPSPAAIMTAKAAAWLATNMERADDRELVLRDCSRAAFHGNPPPPVKQWLADQGITATGR